MRIALYGKNFTTDFTNNIRKMFDIFHKYHTELYIYEEFSKFLSNQEGIKLGDYSVFRENTFERENVDYLFSLGGDGTFLETLTFIKDSNIPVIGINTGRLGFLANISREEISTSVEDLFKGNFVLEDRTLIRIQINKGSLSDFDVALNEITIHSNGMGLISINTELDDEYLNTYWADGLIISTPTGSTAYSMSAGGPIVVPESRNFIISPISPHNLTVRPIVIPDNKKIKLYVKSRTEKFLISLDSRSFSVNTDTVITVEKAPFTLKLVKFKNNSFCNTLRNKLMWGIDKRN